MPCHIALLSITDMHQTSCQDSTFGISLLLRIEILAKKLICLLICSDGFIEQMLTRTAIIKNQHAKLINMLAIVIEEISQHDRTLFVMRILRFTGSMYMGVMASVVTVPL